MNNTKISFAVATNGKKVEKTKLTIKSIRNTYGNAADIHIGGVIDGFKDQEVNLHDFSDSALNGFVGRLRNQTIDSINSDIVVYCDDDVIFPKDWFTNFLSWIECNNFDIMTNKIFLPDGGRYWDKFIVDDDAHTMIEYDQDDPRLSLCTTMFAVKKTFFDNHKFDNDLQYYGGNKNKQIKVRDWRLAEDLEYARRIQDLGYSISFDVNNHVYHNAYEFREVVRTNSYKDFYNVCVQESNLDKEKKHTFVYKRYSIWKSFVEEIKLLDAEVADIKERFEMIELLNEYSLPFVKKSLTDEELLFTSILIDDNMTTKQLRNTMKFVLDNNKDQILAAIYKKRDLIPDEV